LLINLIATWKFYHFRYFQDVLQQFVYTKAFIKFAMVLIVANYTKNVQSKTTLQSG